MNPTPINIVEQWINGDFESFEQFQDFIATSKQFGFLSIVEAAVHLQQDALVEMCFPFLTASEEAVIDVVRNRIFENGSLIDSIERALQVCCSKEHRDVHLEGRLRMERGLLRFETGDFEGAEADLTWAETRLKSVSKASKDHDLSLLNKAAFHLARGEQLMALQVYGEISRHGGHAHETIAISRLGASRIHYGLGQLFDAARHAWNAHYHSILAHQILMAIEAGTLFIEIGLGHQNEDAAEMHIQVEQSVPRDLTSSLPQLSVHPNDIQNVFSWCVEQVNREVSGIHRPDLQAILRIALHLDDIDSVNFLIEKPNEVEDPYLAALCLTVVTDSDLVSLWNNRLSQLSQV